MRVIAGSARGVPLQTVPDNNTRPILDRLKKSLFSMLDSAGLLAGCRVADLYAGTGTLGIEALSRGADYALFVEKRRDAVALLHANLAKTRLSDGADVRQADVTAVLKTLAAQREAGSWLALDLITYDPPFAFSREDATRATCETELALAGTLLREGGRIVLRTEKVVDPPQPAGLTLARHWTDGPHAMCFYDR